MMRRTQQAITIRSHRAAARLKLLTRDGRSQAQVIEEALESVAAPPAADSDVKRRRAELETLLESFDPATIPSIAEFDAREYDDRGNPR